nr:hypothetical protein [Tanacetum cinerariifolium]
IQQYLQNEYYALCEVIEFGDSYEAPQEVADTGSASEGSAKKKGRTVVVMTEDMQKRRNNVKARTTLLLALPDEHQLRFSKYKTAQELWAAILRTFDGNEATKKTKKNQLKQKYRNFKAEGLETLEQTFNRLQAIISHLEFMDVEIEQDDLNQTLLTSLAPEWLMYTIVWRNRSDLDTMSLDDVYNHLKVYEPEVQKKSESNSQNMAFISSAKNISGNGEVNTASIPTASTQVSPASANVAAASISLDTACAYLASQSSGSQIKYEDINQIDEDDIEEIDIKECKEPRSQDKSRRENFKQGSKVEESPPKALMAIDGVGWDWSYMANEEEDYALVAEQEAPTEFALMAKSSSDTELFDNSLCSKACKKNTDSLNTKITKLSEKLSDTKTTLYHYKLGLSEVEARLVEFKNQEIKFREKIRGLEFSVESKNNRIERLTNELEELKKEKEGLDSKLVGFQSASKDLGTLLGSQRSDKNKEGLGYNAVPPPAQVYSPPKKDMSWTGLPEFADDIITDFSRPSPSIESNFSDFQNSDSSVSKNGESSESIMSKPMIKFMKAADSPIVIKTNKDETVRTPMRINRPNMNAAQPKRTSFYKPAHSYVKRPVQRKPLVKTQFRVLRVSTGNTKFPTVNKNFPTGNSKLSTAGLGKKGKAGNSQNNIDDKGYWDSGCSRHMIGNISYLSDYEPYDGGYVSFGQGGCKITGKGTIKTSKLEFKNMYFVKDLKYNMFSVSQICDNKISVLFTDSECILLGRDFKLRDDTNVLLRTPRKHNMYFIDLNNIVPHKDLTCLVVKASADESELWHRRLGKQHKASCMTKLVNSVTKPLHTLHMDLVGPTSDETSGILRNFITEIKHLKDLKGNSQNVIDDKGYLDSGCSWHMTGNISYLSDYEPYDRGYVSFGQGRCKITGKGTIKTGKLEFENVYFVKDLKYNLFSVSQICNNKNSVLFTDSECIVLGRDFKIRDDTNVLLRTHRQHNMYSIDLNNIVPHKDLTCLVAKASPDKSKLWYMRLGHLNFKIMNRKVA